MKWIKLRYKRLIIYAVSYIVLMLFFVFPLPYQLLLPGGVEPTSSLIAVENPYEVSGSFNRSYVYVVTKPSPFQYLIMKENDKVDVYELSEKESQMSISEMNHINNLYKISSVNNAIIAAYKAANKELVYKEAGVVIIDRIYDTPAYEKLAIGDLIIKVNGEDVFNSNELSLMLNNFSCDETITLTVIRDEEEINIDIEKTKYNNECIIGISKNYIFTKYEFDFENSNPKIKSVNYSGYGPSAGLLQALTIYNLITPIDITYGLKIAGTGTIDEDGNVGPIGGIKQKIFGACVGKVDIFFTPYRHLEDAIKARDIMKSDMLIVPVNTLEEAINYLRDNYE